jgi:hypothetical protein
MSEQTKPSIVFADGIWADGSSFSKLIPTQSVGDAKGQVPLQTSAEFVRTYNAQAHEVTDAITAVVINAQAGLNLLRAQSPDLEKVRQALNSIANDGKRAGNIVVRTRALMKKVDAADGAADPRTDSPDEWPM